MAFNSWSPNLVFGDSNNDVDVYASDRDTMVGFTIEPKALTFGQVPVGRTRSQVFRLNNGGTVSVHLLEIGLRGADRSQFLLANDCGTEVVAGTSCELVIRFKPTSVGAKEASLRVETSSGIVYWRKVRGSGVAP